MEVLLEIVRHTAGMAWKIAWGLVLGFGISGVIQACVSKERVSEHLGEADARALALATGFGMASSSCSYAAAAMSKSLYQKGAHIVNATAFLFASTNLVIEIGIVIWTLLGWRFVAAELFGGILLILTMALLLKYVAPRRIFREARRHLERQTGDEGHAHGAARARLGDLLSRKGWAAAGHYFAMDWRMVGRDIALGIAIAGTLAAVVPADLWQTLFLAPETGRPGFWIVLENALVGPLIAILSFVCSVGNIPLAAVLWENGISFAGVVAFIFADLVTIPMVLVYRRYYGWRPALVYSGYLLVTMIAVALVVEGVFRAVGLAPEPAARAGVAAKDYFAWDYTAVLNGIFLPAGAALAWLGTRERPGE